MLHMTTDELTRALDGEGWAILDEETRHLLRQQRELPAEHRVKQHDPLTGKTLIE